MTQPVTDLDRAYASVNALRGEWRTVPDDYRKGLQRGYNVALDAVIEVIYHLGGRDMPGADS